MIGRIARDVARSGMRSTRYPPAPRRQLTPAEASRRSQAWSVVIILSLLAWLLWYHH
jgi:hypothetical protein